MTRQFSPQRWGDGLVLPRDARRHGHEDARRMDHVDDVDGDAEPELAPGDSDIPGDVGSDDGRDDASVVGADATALSARNNVSRRPRAGLATFAMAAAYFLVWLLAGSSPMCRAGNRDAGHALGVRQPGHPRGAGLALIICGPFQLTALKTACLKHCRDPLSMVACHLGTGRAAHGNWAFITACSAWRAAGR